MPAHRHHCRASNLFDVFLQLMALLKVLLIKQTCAGEAITKIIFSLIDCKFYEEMKYGEGINWDSLLIFLLCNKTKILGKPLSSPLRFLKVVYVVMNVQHQTCYIEVIYWHSCFIAWNHFPISWVLRITDSVFRPLSVEFIIPNSLSFFFQKFCVETMDYSRQIVITFNLLNWNTFGIVSIHKYSNNQLWKLLL